MTKIKEITEIPQRLKDIYDPPKILYAFGHPELVSASKIIAIVGTRQITDFGHKITTKIAKKLSSEGYVIISGLAKGVDSAAHWAAINKTIAVLGCGVDIIYPPENKELYYKILENNGAIISEVPPGQFVSRNKFAARNRIISGLAQAVIITECDLRSGSMITAKLALDQGKDIYCVPGSPGTNYLLDQGANDILAAWI